jgi:hypothetical protein
MFGLVRKGFLHRVSQFARAYTRGRYVPAHGLSEYDRLKLAAWVAVSRLCFRSRTMG